LRNPRFSSDTRNGAACFAPDFGDHTAPLSGVRSNRAPGFRMLLLPGLRVGTMRVSVTHGGTRPGKRISPARTEEDLGQLPILDRRRRGTTFVDHRVRSIVNSPESTGMGFWSVNPYVGCEFGCTYCYARYTHRYVVERAHDAGMVSGDALSRFQETSNWEVFERHIFVKQRRAVLAALERDLGRIRKRRSQTGGTHPIVIGTATDPYQPAERRYRNTRAILERLCSERGLSIGLITKSPLICRDIDVLAELQQRHRFTAYISLISVDVRVIKLFEARSPMPHARLRALQKLRRAGITAGINAAPVLPGITDSAFRIEALMAAAGRAQTCFVHPSVLRFYPSVHDGYLPIVERHFPNLLPRYRAAYRANWDAPPHYVAAVERRFERVARKYGIGAKDPLDVRDHTRGEPEEAVQLRLL